MGSRCKTVPYSKNPKVRLHNNNFTEVQLDLDKNLEHHLRYICQKETFIRFTALHQRHTAILLLLQITKTSILCFLRAKENSFYTSIFDYRLFHSIPIGRCSRPIHLTRPKPLRFQIIYLMYLDFKVPFYYYNKNACVYICLHKIPIIQRILNESTERNILLPIVKTVRQKVQAI